MAIDHYLLQRDMFNLGSVRILCMECGRSWWVKAQILEEETPVACPACGHTARVETDQAKALGGPDLG